MNEDWSDSSRLNLLYNIIRKINRPISQFVPVYPGWHWHVYECNWPVQVPCTHGELKQSSGICKNRQHMIAKKKKKTYIKCVILNKKKFTVNLWKWRMNRIINFINKDTLFNTNDKILLQVNYFNVYLCFWWAIWVPIFLSFHLYVLSIRCTQSSSPELSGWFVFQFENDIAFTMVRIRKLPHLDILINQFDTAYFLKLT